MRPQFTESPEDCAARTGETVEQVIARRAARLVRFEQANTPNVAIGTRVTGPVDPKLARAVKTSRVLVLS